MIEVKRFIGAERGDCFRKEKDFLFVIFSPGVYFPQDISGLVCTLD